LATSFLKCLIISFQVVSCKFKKESLSVKLWFVVVMKCNNFVVLIDYRFFELLLYHCREVVILVNVVMLMDLAGLVQFYRKPH